ncbi:MAG: SIMPL domain-containing protein [Gemmatimonadaceae bacterium]
MYRRIGWFVPLVLVASVRSLSAQGTQAPPLGPIITTTAHGEATLIPDRAQISLGVQSRAVSATAAASENARKQDSVIAGLRSIGIRDSQISTQNYSVTPETRYDKDGQAPRTVSYLVANTVRVDISDLHLVGKIIDMSLDHGANQVSSIGFFSSQRQHAVETAVATAVSSAKSQATVMAVAAGGRLGPLLQLSNDGQNYQPQPEVAFRAMAVNSAPETPILAGQQTVTATVTASWRFIPNQ